MTCSFIIPDFHRLIEKTFSCRFSLSLLSKLRPQVKQIPKSTMQFRKFEKTAATASFQLKLAHSRL